MSDTEAASVSVRHLGEHQFLCVGHWCLPIDGIVEIDLAAGEDKQHVMITVGDQPYQFEGEEADALREFLDATEWK